MAALNQVEAAGVRVAVLGQDPRAEDQQGGHHRQGEQEHRPPPEQLQHRPAQHRADGAPAENAPIQNPMAIERCLGSWNMWKISDRVDGARVAPAIPSRARAAIRDSAVGENAAPQRHQPERGRPDHQELAAADAVTQGAHGDQRPGHEEPVDVDDPQQLGAGRLQVRADRGHGQVQHGQVHHVQQAGQGEHRQPDPLAPSGLRWRLGRSHVPRPLVVVMLVSDDAVATASPSGGHRSHHPSPSL